MPQSPPRPFFNPDMRVQTLTLSNGQHCYVVDDALLEPERLVAWASLYRDAFRPIGFSAYPGQFMMLPPELEGEIDACFSQHMRPLFDARRVLRMHARLSMVTLAPSALRAPQWLCHKDNFGVEPTQSIQASVLYLFRDEGLGGTGFYEPAMPAPTMSALFNDAVHLPTDVFAERYDLQPAYLVDSNRYFHRVGGVAARWNRMVFYDGTLLHSGDILAPDRLTDDPATGRLTLNGFYTCRRRAR